MEFLLYPLVFIFGYHTCKTFYVYRSGSLTIGMLKMSQLTCLVLLLRAIEQYAYVRTFGALQLKKKGATGDEVENYKLYINNDIAFFKTKSIDNLVSATPNYFKQVLEFDDWESAMRHMNENKELVDQIIRHRGVK
jgi:hypothetical protein